uniref:Fibroblast growth factor n=1 Tax=Serinus canaria TaxID=9135 RepID=A0A8C9MG16_SERCA
GGIATLPDDGGGGAFPPGHFKDPKRLYCKNGGFFLRINPDGKVDGVREKSDPHIKLQLQAEERGVVSIKGVSANRFLAMKEDGRLLALVSSTCLMSLCCCPALALCGVAFLPAGLTQLLGVGFIRRNELSTAPVSYLK